jgi:hypothetical protein
MNWKIFDASRINYCTGVDFSGALMSLACQKDYGAKHIRAHVPFD